VITRPPLWLACHEAGHAVARLVLDEQVFPGPYLECVSVQGDDKVMGVARMQKRAWSIKPRRPAFEETDLRDGPLDLIETFAGPVAEYRSRYGANGPSGMRPHMAHLVMDAPPDRHDDMADAHHTIEWLALPDMEGALLAAYDLAVELVIEEWRGIVAVARRLRDAGEMDGDEFKEAWRAVRSGRATRAALKLAA
jgi:hypothetical protein